MRFHLRRWCRRNPSQMAWAWRIPGPKMNATVRSVVCCQELSNEDFDKSMQITRKCHDALLDRCRNNIYVAMAEKLWSTTHVPQDWNLNLRVVWACQKKIGGSYASWDNPCPKHMAVRNTVAWLVNYLTVVAFLISFVSQVGVPFRDVSICGREVAVGEVANWPCAPNELATRTQKQRQRSSQKWHDWNVRALTLFGKQLPNSRQKMSKICFQQLRAGSWWTQVEVNIWTSLVCRRSGQLREWWRTFLIIIGHWDVAVIAERIHFS